MKMVDYNALTYFEAISDLADYLYSHIEEYAISRYLYANLEIENLTGYLFSFSDDGYHGYDVYIVTDKNQPEKKSYLIQLVFGSCSVCDPIKAIVSEVEDKYFGNEKYQHLSFDEKHMLAIWEASKRVIDEIITPSTFEIDYNKYFKTGFTAENSFKLILDRVKNGLLALSFDYDLQHREVYKISYNKINDKKYLIRYSKYPIGLQVTKIEVPDNLLSTSTN